MEWLVLVTVTKKLFLDADGVGISIGCGRFMEVKTLKFGADHTGVINAQRLARLWDELKDKQVL